MRVADLGEQGLLQRLHRFCPASMVGDDAAVLTTPEGQNLVITTDALIDGVHFALGLASDVVTMTPEDVGWRAVAANLSDLAAMGAWPIGVTVGLGLPADLPVSTVEGLYEGIVQCLSTYDGVILGGDLHRSPAVSLCITALGQVDPAQVIRRTGAQVGDAIVVTGVHGRSAVGLALLLDPALGAIAQDESEPYLLAHRRPVPRLDLLPLLHGLGVTTGMDSSDGLADAVLQLCRSSGVGARLSQEAIPRPKAKWLPDEQALRWALYGGEDFELVVCAPPAQARELVDQHDGAVIIGEATADPTVYVVGPQDQVAQQLALEQGFQHFSSTDGSA
ncbi:MAG: thiamine-phosphate kinase [Elainellaceae cyanobacterium]